MVSVFVQISIAHRTYFLWLLTLHGNGTRTGTVSCRCVHTGQKQRKGLGAIVSYCASPVPCIGQGPVPVQCDYTTIVAHLHSKILDVPGVPILSISCSFWENLFKSHVGSLGGLAPLPRGNPGSANE